MANERRHKVFYFQPAPEALPDELPRELAKVLDPDDSTTTRERIVCLPDGRTVFVFSTGAVVLGPNLSDVARIERGATTRVTTEIIGVRADGHVIVCDGYVNPHHQWSRDSYRIAPPPFDQQLSETAIHPSDRISVTFDGWELGWSRGGCEVTGRTQSGEPTFRWDAAAFIGGDAEGGHTCILDVMGRPPHGGVWITVKHFQYLHAILLPSLTEKSQPRVLTLQNEEVFQDQYIHALKGASGNLLVYQTVKEVSEPIEDGTFLDSEIRVLDSHGTLYWSWPWRDGSWHDDDGPVRVRYLVGGVSLVLKSRDYWETYAPAEEVYFHSPQSWLVARPDLSFSLEAIVFQRYEQAHESHARVASVVERDGRWLLEVSTIWVRDADQMVRQPVEQNELPGEVATWSSAQDYLVLAYWNGRIEVRPCNQLRTVAMLGYSTEGVPHDLIVLRRPEGTFLVVSAGKLIWYQLPQ